MRFVPVNCIREGVIVGKQVLGKNGELLLNAGTVMRTSFIKKIKEHGYNGIYIEDDFSKNIEISSIISDELKFKTVNALKTTFTSLENNKKNSRENIENLDVLIDNILDEVFSNKELIVNMVDIKVFDDYTYYHSVNVSVLSIIIGISMGFDRNTLSKLGLAALLHDIGKVFISKDILNKPCSLTDEEYDVMKTHSQKGYEYLKYINKFSVSVYAGILHHHERYDGTGYPAASKGDQISVMGRIISVADVYDAMTSDRPYRKALLPSEAIEYIMGAAGSLFDDEIVKHFIKHISAYPLGTCVRLSNNSTGLVIENFKDCCLRPKIRVILHGDTMVEPYILDLRNDSDSLNITIVEIVNL